jgi:hypothetical protein
MFKAFLQNQDERFLQFQRFYLAQGHEFATQAIAIMLFITKIDENFS